jgi:Carboxypeptidase regulatory-like domain
MRVEISGFAVLLLATLLSVQAHAQVAGGTLSGTISDPSGAVIPDAQISMSNVATGITRNIATDPAGFYTVPNLLPGNYEITVSALDLPLTYGQV